MSESLIKQSVAQEISELASLAETDCAAFAHRIYNAKVAFAGPGNNPILSIAAPDSSAVLITGIDVKTLYDIADAALVGDFRSSFDLNPYGPYSLAAAVGVIQIFINDKQYCADMFDIGLINAKILLVIDGGQTLVVKANPHQPAGKNLTLVTRAIGYTVPQTAADFLKKKQTQFIAATP